MELTYDAQGEVRGSAYVGCNMAGQLNELSSTRKSIQNLNSGGLGTDHWQLAIATGSLSSTTKLKLA